ncbi:hypothetical protein [Alteromonas halophila]|uniref:Sulfotransferase family protein n=1 Tax=Alteromonas halophila TaxID=516698 RepID=A0A918JNG9_9ALTE|nr:hypothetical protein [Alteromonas halophila]GGW92514.1 hypothetical protein GCM10007391_28620 [Alteromonas halophila]
MSVMQRKITLLTGIPRSGTTLCCYLINKSTKALALHEPINPQKLTATSCQQAIDEVAVRIHDIEHKITNGLPFEHGDKNSIALDNPVAENNASGIRKVQAVRGNITLAPCSKDIPLFIKQNALFTSLLPDLQKQFPVVGIVRNPVNVLLSWMQVDLPVNKGHIPAGERFDPALKRLLNSMECNLSRQLSIYHWFTQNFLSAGIPVVRYEDILLSGGQRLFNELAIHTKHQELTQKHRQFESAHKDKLRSHINELSALSPFYSYEEVCKALTP